MSDIEWFENEFRMVEDFKRAITPLIEQAEMQKEKMEALEVEEAARLKLEHRETLEALYRVKKEFLADELVDTLETLTSAEGGAEVSELACTLMKKATDLLRAAGMGQY